MRALVTELDVIAGDAAATAVRRARLARRAGAPARRVRATAEGSAKPIEVARALGVWGRDDPRAEHALVARLGVVMSGVRVTELAAPAM